MTKSRFKRNVVDNERGIAALTVVLLGVVLVGIIALSFLARTETKQYGSALTSTGNNAFLTAEAGLRYTEKCLLNNDPACPAVTANADWTNLTTGYTKTFGSGNGQFTITFAPIDTRTVVVTSVGTFRGSSREVSKTVSKGLCKLTQNVVTSCNNVQVQNNVTVVGTIETGYCPSPPLVDTVAFPAPIPGTCPSPDYVNFNNGVPALAPPYQYCNWTQSAGVVTIDGPVTIWVAGDFSMSLLSNLVINGDVTINVAGTVSLADTATITVNGTLTFYSAGTFTMVNSSVINAVGGPGDVIVLTESDFTMDNISAVTGGVISNSKLQMKRDSVLTGGLIVSSGSLGGNDVQLMQDVILTHDANAGINTTGYPECFP